MKALIPDYAQTIQRAVAAYNGLIELYQQDQDSSPYFAGCLAQAITKRNGLQERLANPVYLADVFEDTYYQSIDHFLDGHRGEYGPDIPSTDPAKELLASQYLAELKRVMDEIIRTKNAQREQAWLRLMTDYPARYKQLLASAVEVCNRI